MAGKAAGAYLTISEVSEKLDVPAHVLRFWETKFTQLKPLKRGGGRRYYREADIALLMRIRNLLYKDGFTIKGAQKALKSPDAGVEQGDAKAANNAVPGQEHVTSDQPIATSAEKTETKSVIDPASASLKPSPAQTEPELLNQNIKDLRSALETASAKIDELLGKISK